MNLLFITNKFPPLGCGVGDYTYHLAREFVKNSHEVSVICKTDKAIKKHWQSHDEGFKVYPIGGNWQRRDWKLVLENIQQIKPDTVLFQYVPGSYHRYAVPWQLFYFYRKLHQLPIKIVTTFHETYVRYNWRHPKYLYVAIGQRIIGSYIAKKSHQLITSIDRYARQLKKWNQNVTIIPVGSNILPVPISSSEINQLRRSMAPNGEAILCTFGNRNHQPLLRLFEKILEIKPDTVLLIIGKLNANLDGFSSQLQQQVFSTGFLKSTDVYRHLKASDVFIMLDYVGPKGEGGTSSKSGSLAAAFSAGLPIFATKGDMTNQLLIEESGIVWINYWHSNSDFILTNLKKLEIEKINLFYEKRLNWTTIYNQIIQLYG